jgi:hypothetical protein
MQASVPSVAKTTESVPSLLGHTAALSTGNEKILAVTSEKRAEVNELESQEPPQQRKVDVGFCQCTFDFIIVHRPLEVFLRMLLSQWLVFKLLQTFFSKQLLWHQHKWLQAIMLSCNR